MLFRSNIFILWRKDTYFVEKSCIFVFILNIGMRLFVILFSFLLFANRTVKAQTDTISYGVIKNMPAFYEQLKQQLTYPEAWGNSTTKDFGKWRAEARKTVMECMQNLPPAPKEYDMSVVGTEQRAGYEARKIWFNVSEWSRIPAYLLVPDGKGPFPRSEERRVGKE